MIEQLNSKLPFTVQSIQKLHFGENKSFLVTANRDLYLLKLYRSNRGFKLTPEQEVGLTQRVAQLGVNTCEYVKFSNDRYIEHLGSEEISLQRLLHASMIYRPDKEYYFNLGRELKKLHSCVKKNDIKFDVTVYNFQTLIEDRWYQVKNAAFLDQRLVAQLELYKDMLEDKMARVLEMAYPTFIHFDAHTGNILFNKDKTYFIDWEESGLGHYLLDLAVPCMFLMKDEEREQKLASLILGYGTKVDLRLLNYMTMIKFFYILTYIPTRTDILSDPKSVFERYLNYFERLTAENIERE